MKPNTFFHSAPELCVLQTVATVSACSDNLAALGSNLVFGTLIFLCLWQLLTAGPWCSRSCWLHLKIISYNPLSRERDGKRDGFLCNGKDRAFYQAKDTERLAVQSMTETRQRENVSRKSQIWIRLWPPSWGWAGCNPFSRTESVKWMTKKPRKNGLSPFTPPLTTPLTPPPHFPRNASRRELWPLVSVSS